MRGTYLETGVCWKLSSSDCDVRSHVCCCCCCCRLLLHGCHQPSHLNLGFQYLHCTATYGRIWWQKCSFNRYEDWRGQMPDRRRRVVSGVDIARLTLPHFNSLGFINTLFVRISCENSPGHFDFLQRQTYQLLFLYRLLLCGT